MRTTDVPGNQQIKCASCGEMFTALLTGNSLEPPIYRSIRCPVNTSMRKTVDGEANITRMHFGHRITRKNTGSFLIDTSNHPDKVVADFDEQSVELFAWVYERNSHPEDIQAATAFHNMTKALFIDRPDALGFS